jgi:hypothetical protein
MKLKERINLLINLGQYLSSDDKDLIAAKDKAYAENQWFTPHFIDLSLTNIVSAFLNEKILISLSEKYKISDKNNYPKKVGIVMAGNIPLVGFHDWLCVFLNDDIAIIKLSSRDDALFRHIYKKLVEWDNRMEEYIKIQQMIPNCDAYIATGSNNSSLYFEYYFRKYPSIIRKNRTSVAILDGSESKDELQKLADDVFTYFGLGCRNVSKIFVPEKYDFVQLLEAFKSYENLANHNKYKNNYEYNLAVLIMNNKYYMTNETILLVENKSNFSPIGQLNYEFYTSLNNVKEHLSGDETIQCIVGNGFVPFGNAQCPGITDFADGRDTMDFIMKLNKNSRNLQC